MEVGEVAEVDVVGVEGGEGAVASECSEIQVRIFHEFLTSPWARRSARKTAGQERSEGTGYFGLRPSTHFLQAL